tara:strand:- start:58 stop:534 length:477 start_codon:yes stop_codon:yes gene_type:complete
MAASKLSGTVATARMPTGSVLQVVQNTTTTTTHINSSTTLTTATNINVAITPSSSSSKILVTINAGGLLLGTTNAVLFNMLRDSTTIVARARQGYNSSSASEWSSIPFVMSYLDSPSTTSAITYSFKIGMGASSSSQLQINAGTGTNDAIVTAMEIAG